MYKKLILFYFFKELTRILTPELRMQAFHLAASAHSNVFDILSKLYYLQGPDNSFLVSRVRVMLARQQFKEVSSYNDDSELFTLLALNNYYPPPPHLALRRRRSF